jgi:hypothetical protein
MKMGSICRMLDENTSQRRKTPSCLLGGKICFINPASSRVRKMAKGL